MTKGRRWEDWVMDALAAEERWPNVFTGILGGVQYLNTKLEGDRCPDGVYVTLNAMLATDARCTTWGGPPILPWTKVKRSDSDVHHIGHLTFIRRGVRLLFWATFPDGEKVEVTDVDGPWWDYLAGLLPELVEQYRTNLTRHRRWVMCEEARRAAEMCAKSKAEEKKRQKLLRRAGKLFQTNRYRRGNRDGAKSVQAMAGPV
jgi:hypothetical protein